MRASLKLACASVISLLLSHAQAMAASGGSSPGSNLGQCEPDDGSTLSGLPSDMPDSSYSDPTPSDATYYVSPSGNDAWSGRLPAPNANRTDGPVLTLARARDLARARRQHDPGGVAAAIVLREGRYRRTMPVVFTNQDAGIRLVAYPNESPALSGAMTLYPPPAKQGGPIALPLINNPGRDIFVGDIRHSVAFKSRPADAGGWTAVASPLPVNSFAYRAADFAPGDIVPGTVVELLDQGRSYDIVTRISAIDPVKGIATVSPPAYGAIENIDSFRLLGRAKWATKPGSFAWDEARRQLTLLPARRSSASVDGIRVPVLSSILIFQNTDHISVAGLTFVETRIADVAERNSAAVVLDGTHDMIVRGNDFHNVGQAVRLIGAAHSMLVGNHISETGAAGIELQDSSDRNAVLDNELTGIGRTDRAATAIYLHGASANRVAGNVIKDVARHGIGVDNWDDQTINSANVIEENQVWKTSRTAFDSGAIEMLGRSRKDTASIIRFNDIRDARPLAVKLKDPRESLASGIYLDDFTSGVLICGNRISGAPLTAIQIHGGSHISIRDNLVLLDRPGAVFVFSQAADSNEEGQRFDFKLPEGAAAPGSHTVAITFDNDAVVGNEDRDLFVGKISIGSKSISAATPNAQYLLADGRELPGQAAMPWNGKLVWTLPEGAFAEDAGAPLSVYAWSSPAGGIGAHFIVSVDGVALGDGVAGPTADRMTDNRITGNIVYTTAKGAAYFKMVQSGPPAIDANIFVDRAGRRTDPLVDRAATVVDPGFRNPGHGDFRLDSSSALLAAGFRDLPFCLSEGAFCPDAGKRGRPSITRTDHRGSKVGFQPMPPSTGRSLAEFSSNP